MGGGSEGEGGGGEGWGGGGVGGGDQGGVGGGGNGTSTIVYLTAIYEVRDTYKEESWKALFRSAVKLEISIRRCNSGSS